MSIAIYQLGIAVMTSKSPSSDNMKLLAQPGTTGEVERRSGIEKGQVSLLRYGNT